MLDDLTKTSYIWLRREHNPIKMAKINANVKMLLMLLISHFNNNVFDHHPILHPFDWNTIFCITIITPNNFVYMLLNIELTYKQSKHYLTFLLTYLPLFSISHFPYLCQIPKQQWSTFENFLETVCLPTSENHSW